MRVVNYIPILLKYMSLKYNDYITDSFINHLTKSLNHINLFNNDQIKFMQIIDSDFQSYWLNYISLKEINEMFLVKKSLVINK